MSRPAVKQNDRIVAVDSHIVLVPTPPGAPVPTPLLHNFNGAITISVSTNVRIMGRMAAMQGSQAMNTPAHFPTPPGTAFAAGMPTNQGTIMAGSATVYINGKPAARVGDQVRTCAEPVPNLSGQIVLSGPCTVMIGG